MIRKIAVSILLFAFILTFSQGSIAAPGDLDTTFGGSGSVGIDANTLPVHVRIQPDGRIMTLGDYPYGEYSYLSRNYMDGSADAAFGSGGYFLTQYYPSMESMRDFVGLPDGRYLVVGEKDGVFALFRYNSNGTRDITFGVNGVMTPQVGNAGNSTGNSIVIQSDGKIIVAGRSDTGFLIRYNADGSADTSFGTSGVVSSDFPDLGNLTLQPDGKVLTWASGQPQKIIRFNTNGSFDTDFGTAGVLSLGFDHGGDLALSPDGKIVVSGRVTNLSSMIARYDASGRLDTAFGTNGSVLLSETAGNSYSFGRATAVAVQRNGKVVIAGDSNAVFSVERFNVDGSIDETFGTNGSAVTPFAPICRFYDITIQPDGRLVAVGDAGSVSSAQYVGLVRYIGDPPSVTIAGKVMTPDGRGLRNAVVKLVDSTGLTRIATTSSFGNYEFEGVSPNESYTISTASKRYRFPSMNLQIDGNLTNVDLVGLE